jgi:AcrR family transcriptional regulator
MRDPYSEPGTKVDGRTALSAETRRRLIEAAIEVFGRLGFEGASTRALMDRAGANLAAIPYHFGGKRGLYLAAARVIADYARERVGPIVMRLCDPGRAEPIARLNEALTDFIHLLFAGPEPKSWVAFFVRCEHEADDAFRMIYEDIITPFRRALIGTVSEATGCEAGDETLQMRITIVLTSVINTRTLQNMILSGLGWDELGPARIERLANEIRRLALVALLPADAAARAGI